MVQRLALEFYYLGKWMTPEFALLIANAPDAYAFTMDASQHYHHWAQNFADEAGYLRDPNHVQMKVDFCRLLGLTDDDIRGYTPGMVRARRSLNGWRKRRDALRAMRNGSAR